MKPGIYIYGTGGHSKVVTAMILSSNAYEIIAYIDAYSSLDTFLQKPIIRVTDLPGDRKVNVVLAFGDNQVRRKVCAELVHISNINYPNIIDSSVNIQGEALSCVGTCIMPGVNINSHHQIGSFCVLNTGAILEHDCTMNDYSFLAPSSAIAGNVSIGEASLVGINATIIQGLSIGSNSLIAAGAVVLKSIPDNETWAGIPAKKIKSREKMPF